MRVITWRKPGSRRAATPRADAAVDLGEDAVEIRSGVTTAVLQRVFSSIDISAHEAHGALLGTPVKKKKKKSSSRGADAAPTERDALAQARCLSIVTRSRSLDIECVAPRGSGGHAVPPNSYVR